MNIRLLLIGKTQQNEIDHLVQDYASRLGHYCRFKMECLEPKLKKGRLEPNQIKELEGSLLLKNLPESSFLILLDERGKEFDSVGFAAYLQKRLNAGPKELVFCIGGAYGFSDEVYKRANSKIALSQMTLTHQMVRLFAIEQIYRAFTILKGEKYHH